MFIDEAKMVAGLAHPNIVQIFDLGQTRQELLHRDGVRARARPAHDHPPGPRARPPDPAGHLDLRRRARSAPPSSTRTARRTTRASPCSSSTATSAPQNILISFEGDVKLTDFGIAKAASKASTTDKGALRGKLLYMSPEQAWGKTMDKRSDVFSLGIVFYEMLTEQKPFLGTSETSILETVRECRVPPPDHDQRQDPGEAREGRDEGARAGSRGALPGRGRHAARPGARPARMAARHRQPASSASWRSSSTSTSGATITAPEGDAHARAGSGIDELAGARAGAAARGAAARAAGQGPDVHPEAAQAVRHQVEEDVFIWRCRKSRSSSTRARWR